MTARRAAVLLAVLASAATARALDADLRRRARDADPGTRAEAAKALAREGSTEAAHLLADLLADRDAGVRDAAVLACDALQDAAAVKSLAAAARNGDELTRRNCAEALGRTKCDAALPALETFAASDSSPQVRADALDALSNFKGAAATAAARSAVGEKDATVRAAAIDCLGRVGGDGALDAVRKALADADDGVRCVARSALRVASPADAAAGFAAAATDPSWRVRAQCVDDAAALGGRQSVGILVELVGDDVTRVSAAAHRTLQTLTGKEFGRDPELWAAWWQGNRATWTAPASPARDAVDDPRRTTASYHGLEVATGAAVFVADLSGSMKEPAGADGRSRWAVAADELRSTLAALPESFVTNLVFFQQEARAALPRPQPLTKTTRDKLDAFITSGSPAHEGDLLGAVLAALAQEGIDTVFVLSDGSPSAGDMVERGRVRDAIRRRNRTRKCVIDAIGFGARKAAERGFLEGLARDSAGRCVFRGDVGK
jgi:HEAT repeat protein